MSDVEFSIAHGRTKQEACACLATAVGQAEQQFRPLLHRVEWSAGRDSVRLSGAGFEIDAVVDDREIHVSGRVPLFARLFAAPLALGLKQLTERALEDRSREPTPRPGTEV
jgi:hypothetical protein